MALTRESIFDAGAFEATLAVAPQSLPVFREALARGQARLKERYAEKPSESPQLVSLHAWLVDQIITRAWRFFHDRLRVDTGMALVAVGGYGRGELHPFSDIDLLILVERPRASGVRGFVEESLRFLWDIGLQVGHSVRTIKDCIGEAKRDLTVVTNLMEARLLEGDAALYERMRVAIQPKRLWPSAKFFVAKLAEQRARHQRFHDTAYNLEPNVKDGPGGLRDIQMIAWVAQRHFGTESLHDLVKRGFLSEGEYRKLMRGRNLLWKVRDGLHHLANRREDRLLFDYQRALARQFGYRDRLGILAVELFMKRYYRTIKELSLLNEILLQHFQEALLWRGRARIRPINRRFQDHNGYLEARGPRVFERAPYALLELFLIMQQRPLKGVRADTIRLVLANLHRIDAKFRRDLACRTLFMEIMRQPRGITHELRRMNAYGVLGAYLPAFGRIVGQMQHDLFHVYTVDQHSLFVLRNLRRMTIPEHRHELPFASELIEKIVKPERLYLAGLFHDIAKGRGGDHSVLGEQEVESFCRLHNLSDYDTRLICWLVRQHLLMSATAQREDISDPDVVQHFAEQVGDQERLDNLYLLTVADMRGTSPVVWNTWKGRLLAQLYSATAQSLRRGIATPHDIEAHIADLRRDTLALLKRQHVSPELATHFWANLEPDYFLRHDADSLAWHARVIARTSSADLPVVATRYSAEVGGSEFLFYAPDREDLFSIVTGGFDRLNLSIVDARVHTLRNGFALDTFVVLDSAGESISEPRALKHLGEVMRQQLVDPKPGRDLIQARLPRTLAQFPIDTRVHFTNAPNKSVTIMEVTAQDRPGLLYQVALALKHCDVNLVTAKVATYGERAEDIFFINTRGRVPLGPAQERCLADEITRRLGAGPVNARVVAL